MDLLAGSCSKKIRHLGDWAEWVSGRGGVGELGDLMGDGCITNYQLGVRFGFGAGVLHGCGGKGRGGEVGFWGVGRMLGRMGGESERILFFFSPRPRSHQFSLIRLIILSNQIELD